ncbi:helix-turn-helix transcriptional regulator [Hyphococcus sp.]|uniref:helix-turn-helix transcriptional regulator n=1 Tax=Hyphococcus sp. TaxID=2038636 RepID=UPI0020800B62|nr:MAG: hypothetical protein DHS20C04_00270 [Marinicaulis sp.]
MAVISVDEFIQRSAEASTIQELVHLFEELFSGMGFETISYHAVRSAFRSIPAGEGARVSGDSGLVDKLFGSELSIDFDPAISDLLEKLAPFHWFTAEGDERASTLQQQIFDTLKAEGFIDGLAVPVMTKPGELVLFALSKRGVTYSFTDVELRKLQLACHSMHLRFEELKNGDPKLVLTARETDVMRLAARGKSNKEIALALGVSAHTVDTLIRRCFSKLGVSNRIEASIMFTFNDRQSA